MLSEKEIEAAIKAIEAVPIMGDTYSLSGEDAKAAARAALEAAARVRAEDNAGEPVAWGEDIDGKIVSVRLDKSRHCTVPLYRTPQPSRAPTSLSDAEKAFLDRVWPRLQNGCYRAHNLIPIEIQRLDFNEFIRDGLCAVFEAAASQPSESKVLVERQTLEDVRLLVARINSLHPIESAEVHQVYDEICRALNALAAGKPEQVPSRWKRNRHECPTCGGSGEIAPDAECPDCDGTGACVPAAPTAGGGDGK